MEPLFPSPWYALIIIPALLGFCFFMYVQLMKQLDASLWYLEEPVYELASVDTIKGINVRFFEHNKAKLERLGFSLITAFYDPKRTKEGSINYQMVMVSADQKTFALLIHRKSAEVKIGGPFHWVSFLTPFNDGSEVLTHRFKLPLHPEHPHWMAVQQLHHWFSLSIVYWFHLRKVRSHKSNDRTPIIVLAKDYINFDRDRAIRFIAWAKSLNRPFRV